MNGGESSASQSFTGDRLVRLEMAKCRIPVHFLHKTVYQGKAYMLHPIKNENTCAGKKIYHSFCPNIFKLCSKLYFRDIQTIKNNFPHKYLSKHSGILPVLKQINCNCYFDKEMPGVIPSEAWKTFPGNEKRHNSTTSYLT